MELAARIWSAGGYGLGVGLRGERLYALVITQDVNGVAPALAGMAAVQGWRLRLRSDPWPELEEELNAYLAGVPVALNYPVYWGGYSPFQRKVLEAAQTVPYATTISYRQLAERAGVPRAWRACGQALRANRVPLVIPCHRVVRSDGSLGGFALGINLKRRLLAMEQAALRTRGTILRFGSGFPAPLLEVNRRG